MTRILMLISVVLCYIQECVSFNACPESSGKVINACTADNISLAEIFYINTGLAPTHEANRCRCDIYPHGEATQLSFKLENDKSDGNQEIEVNGVKFNPSNSVLTVLIYNRTELWVSTNGIGGICLSVELDKSNSVDIVCERIKRPSDPKLEDQKNEIIGPVAGAGGGFLFVLVVLIILVLYKRRHKSGKNEKPTNSTDNPTGNNVAKSEDAYQTMTENPMSDKTEPDSFEMQESSNSLKLKAATKTVAKRNEHEKDATCLSGSETDMTLYCYSAVKARVKPQSNHPVLDNVYDQTSKPNKIMASVNEYDHFGVIETSNVPAINVYDRAKIDNHSNTDKTGHSFDYDTAMKRN